MADTSRIVMFGSLGGPDVLQIEHLPVPQPAPGEVRIQVKAIGLNRSDIMWREGQYPIKPELPAKIGRQAAGVVDAVGDEAATGWLGKRVSCVPTFSPNRYGVYGDVAILPIDALAEIPSQLSFDEGAAISSAYLPAWGMLIKRGRLRSGDHVLVTAASSSTGLAAIQLIGIEGGISIATTRTAAKKADLIEAGADHVIVTDDEDIVARVMEITSGKGARLVYDPIAGPGLEKLAAAASVNGTILAYGMLSSEPTPLPLLQGMLRQLTFVPYSAPLQIYEEPAVLSEGQRYLNAHIVDGGIRPHLADRVFSLEEIADAHAYMQSDQHVGKIIVRP